MRFVYLDSRFTLAASSPRSVALAQLQFTSLAVASSRRDLHPQKRAHAGRTTKRATRAGLRPCAPRRRTRPPHQPTPRACAETSIDCEECGAVRRFVARHHRHSGAAGGEGAQGWARWSARWADCPALLVPGWCGATRCAPAGRSAQTGRRKSEVRSALRAPSPSLRCSAPHTSLRPLTPCPVSYTHLTLPTSDLV